MPRTSPDTHTPGPPEPPVPPEPPAPAPHEHRVPVLDLGLDRPSDPAHRLRTAAAIRRACETSGFFVVTGHGVPDVVVAALHERARSFFTGPAEEKERVANDPADPLQHGFGANPRMELFGASRAGETDRPDTAPGQDFAALGSRNRWPDLPGFREAFLDYYAAVDDLSLDLLRLFALALDLPERWFDDKFDRQITPLMANYYPPRPASGWSSPYRNSPHLDIGALTVLYQDDTPCGLEIRTADGQWHPVPPVPGSFVVNIGSLMTRWTNDRWSSALHRVVNPTDDLADRDRISLAFFCQPNPDADIAALPTCTGPDDPARHPPVRAGDYFLAKSRRFYLQRRLGRSDALR
ncbi:isopenicillin N synthase family dioxygenase [Streptomyces sp. NPDC057052]|uniref:isopenicillin N synthase family dioxygenase n=1 Tax=Streptomyces sp. NPDC057052 TaxID=3346010 RepID=UPI00362E2C85